MKYTETYEHVEEEYIEDNLIDLKITSIDITVTHHPAPWIIRMFGGKGTLTADAEIHAITKSNLPVLDAILALNNGSKWVVTYFKDKTIILKGMGIGPSLNLQNKTEACVIYQAFAEGSAGPR